MLFFQRLHLYITKNQNTNHQNTNHQKPKLHHQAGLKTMTSETRVAPLKAV